MTVYCEREDCVSNKTLKCCADGLRLSATGECLMFHRSEELSSLCAEGYCVPSNVDKPLVYIIRGNWRGFEPRLRELGFELIPKPRTGLCSFGIEEGKTMAWCFYSTFEDEFLTTKGLEAAGLPVGVCVEEAEREMWKILKVRSLMTEEEIQKERAALTEPIPPLFVDGKVWNGKLYGYPGRKKIWLNGYARDLRGFEEKELEKYLANLEQYRKNVTLLRYF